MEIMLDFNVILCYYIFRRKIWKIWKNQDNVVLCSVLYINLHAIRTGTKQYFIQRKGC